MGIFGGGELGDTRELALWKRYSSLFCRLDGLIKDEAKLRSYIDNALIPMVDGLKDELGLGGWDIINEPEGEMIPETNNNPCEDTAFLSDSGMGWEGKLYTAHEIQR